MQNCSQYVATHYLHAHDASFLLHHTKQQLSGWSGISENALRSLSLTTGHVLESIDLSATGVTDEMLDVMCTRLFNLRSLNLARCSKVTNLGLRTLSQSCAATITSLDLSHCAALNSEGLAWIGGTIGFGGGCSKLQSINLSNCTAVEDRGLISLAQGCKQLRFISLACCSAVRDRGVIKLIQSSSHLAVINLSECSNLSNAVVTALGSNCSKLISLNMGRIGCVHDSGLRAVANGCKALTALNISGSKAVSERGLCYLALRCKALNTLNVTGCTNVTPSGLDALIGGISDELVVSAKTFFGFVPKDSTHHTDIKLQLAQKALELNAARRIEKQWLQHYNSIKAARDGEQQQRDTAALTIQMAFTAYLKQKAKTLQKLAVLHEACAVIIQSVYRGYRARQLAKQLRAEHVALLAKGPYAVPLQSAFRGYTARKHNYNCHNVAQALVSLKRDRTLELREAASVKLGAFVRWWLSKQKCIAWTVVKRQRDRDRAPAIRILQGIARMYIAKCTVKRLRYAASVKHAREMRAATRIQASVRGYLGIKNIVKLRLQRECMWIRMHRSALRIQAGYRGKLGRDIGRLYAQLHSQQTAAAVRIQSVFRGSRILNWRGLRMNRIALHVLQRQELEYDAHAQLAARRNERRIREANQDSCSDNDDDQLANGTEGSWEEIWDPKRYCTMWYNKLTGDYSDTAPFAYQESFVGMRVQVYWPLQQCYYSGVIARYNRAKGKHRIEYSDGEHEWLVLEEEKNRLTLEVNGAWIQFINYIDPAEVELKQQVEVLRAKQRRNAPMLEHEQGWYKVYDETLQITKWYNTTTTNNSTSEALIAKIDADDWQLLELDTAELAYVNSVTGETIYYEQGHDLDPRFELNASAQITAKQTAVDKESVLQDIHMSSYMCQHLVDRLQQLVRTSPATPHTLPPLLRNTTDVSSGTDNITNTALQIEAGSTTSGTTAADTVHTRHTAKKDVKTARILVDQIRDSKHITQLGTAVTVARKLFTMHELDSMTEFQTAVTLLQCMLELQAWALDESIAISNDKKAWMRGGTTAKNNISSSAVVAVKHK
jgi:IQ calmodulin-binding motif/Leucine Rich repeat